MEKIHRYLLECLARCLFGLSGSPSESESCSPAADASSVGIPNETVKDPGTPSQCPPPSSSPSLWDATLPLTLGPPTLRMPLPAPDADGCCKMTSTCPSFEGEPSTNPCCPSGSRTEHGRHCDMVDVWIVSTASLFEIPPAIPRALPREALPRSSSVCSDRDTWTSTMSPGEKHRCTPFSLKTGAGPRWPSENCWGSLGNSVSVS